MAMTSLLLATMLMAQSGTPVAESAVRNSMTANALQERQAERSLSRARGARCRMHLGSGAAAARLCLLSADTFEPLRAK
jgi:hypothetical protein